MSKDSSNITPPRWADRFLMWYCKDEELEILRGDVYELFEERLEKYGELRARWHFVLDVLDLFRPFAIKAVSTPTFYYFRIMLGNYFKISFRNFVSHKGHSFINLGGLVTGLVACLLIALYVSQELSYDRFHPRVEDTYRIVMDMFGGGELKTKSAVIYPAVAPGLKAEFPEVEEFTRILPFATGVYSRKNEDGSISIFNEEKAVLADETFFEMFGFELLKGKANEVLSQKSQIVLSESTAGKYFGEENPVGKSLFFNGKEELIVSGVMADFPKNSHMQFDMITSLKTWDNFEAFPEIWGWYDFYTFVRLSPQADRKAFEEKLAGFLDIKKADQYKEFHSREALWSQSIADIHLYSVNLSWDMGENGGADQVYFLVVVAVLILIIAWINFINLSTARAVKRAREVGVRKVVGARRSELIAQFLIEAFMYNALAVLIAVSIVFALVPLVNHLMGLTLSISMLYSWPVLLALVSLTIGGTLVSGLYPAFVLSSFRPLDVLKTGFFSQRKQFGFRQILVVFQFAASLILITGTFLVIKQLSFMKSHDLGLNIEQTIVLKAPTSSTGPDDLQNRLETLKNTVKQIPEIKSISTSSSVPGIENFSISGFTSRHFPEELRDCYVVRVDEHFMPDYEIELLAGRNFIRGMATDSFAAVINTRAMKHLGFENPEEAIGEKINPGKRREWTIIGVVENYHQASVRQELDPVLFFFRPDRVSYYSLKTQTADYTGLLANLETQWEEIYPDNPFDYFFLDETFARQYQSEERFSKIFSGFSLLAILVACLGLFGLVSFTAEQSKKEIGIRKVLGASVSQLVTLLLKDYTRLIFIAMAIGFPLAWYLMDRWLQEFAYRTEIGAEIFIICGFLILLISFLTISRKSWTAAMANPSDVLRNE